MFMKLILKKFPKKYDSSSFFLYYTYMQLGTTYPSIKSCTYYVWIFWYYYYFLNFNVYFTFIFDFFENYNFRKLELYNKV